jgi:hypothetical protein
VIKHAHLTYAIGDLLCEKDQYHQNIRDAEGKIKVRRKAITGEHSKETTPWLEWMEGKW